MTSTLPSNSLSKINRNMGIGKKCKICKEYINPKYGNLFTCKKCIYRYNHTSLNNKNYIFLSIEGFKKIILTNITFRYLKQLIKENYVKCQYCKINRATHIHHKDTNRDNNKHNNLMIVCKKCHYFIHCKILRTNKRQMFIFVKKDMGGEQNGTKINRSKEIRREY